MIKFLTAGNHATYVDGFDYTPYLPKGNRPGKWLPKISKLKLYNCGYHYCRVETAYNWLHAQCFEVEPRGASIEDNDICVQQFRFIRRLNWDERIARLFAADCAAHVLHLYTGPSDAPRRAIEVARAFANGRATIKDLLEANKAAEAAARSAARSAAMSEAARSAAMSAAESAWSIPESVAGSATRSAAELAAYSVAQSVAESEAISAAELAGSAERKWQMRRLKKYLLGARVRPVPLPKKRGRR